MFIGSGALPAGLSLGTLPTAGANYAPAPTFKLTCYPQPAYLGSPYGSFRSATGGNPPYSAAITGGTLPPGILLDPSGGIYGTPTAMGTFTQTVTATDSTVPPQKTSASMTITVGLRLPETGVVTITASSGGIVNTTTISVTVP